MAARSLFRYSHFVGVFRVRMIAIAIFLDKKETKNQVATLLPCPPCRFLTPRRYAMLHSVRLNRHSRHTPGPLRCDKGCAFYIDYFAA